MARCDHDKNGGRETVTIPVGNERITYEKISCSKCGAIVENNIIERERMDD